jgi:uncharacterized protein
MPPRSRPRRCRSLRWLGFALAGPLVLCFVAIAVLLICEDRLLYHPVPASRRWVDPPPGAACKEGELRAADGTVIHARYFTGTNADGAVLICHGRAGNLSLEWRPHEASGWLEEIRVSALIFDYPGYGKSGGQPREAGCYAAAEAAYQWLTRRRGVPPDKVLLYGRSLGSAVAVDVASGHRHRALVLVSPFPSLPEVVRHRCPLLPAHRLMRNRFATGEKIGACRRPLFVVHGTDDGLVPFALGQALFDAADAPKQFLAVAGGRHGDCITAESFPALRRFVEGTEPVAP